VTDTWYYLVESSRLGPVTVERLRELFSKEKLQRGTLVWKAAMPGWTAAEEVPDFADVVPEDTPAPEVPPSPTEPATQSDASAESEAAPSFPELLAAEGLENSSRSRVIDGVNQVRPWVRYFARMIDQTLALAIYLSSIPHLGTELTPLSPFFALLPIALWMLLESLFLSSIGTTPGKWLLRIEVRSGTGELPSLEQSLRRSLYLWVMGLAMGLPMVVLLAQLLGYRQLTQAGVTTWDRSSGCVVRHHALDPHRIGLAVSVALLALLWAASALAPLMPPTMLPSS